MMEMATRKALTRLLDAVKNRKDLDVLADMVLVLQTADKFRLAAMMLDEGIPDLAATVGKRACDEIRLSALLGSGKSDTERARKP